jgi:hypothetical protein
MKVLVSLSIVVTFAAAPAFSACVAPLNDVKIPNGNKATMQEILAANEALQENTTEIEAYTRCLKAEQQAKLDAIGPDITDQQRSKIASEYVNRQNAESEKLQKLAGLYDVAVRNFRAKQAAAESTDQANEQAAAVNAAEQDTAEKARHDAAAGKTDEGAKKPAVPKGNSR